ncbi:P68 family surface lipoprotein [Mycoplasmopsis alligatoris]|uniref:Lipoprotein n=1 Tax=Mycoplasmopsis alligatoris A21JP2 TaxID=747682 RepID=D4XV51_9BACT|nr:hypothetical protein [Mycoplasmopsis alligatoris]EFF41765.1 conserved hypothetical protein [Mycoplasmopsis alligatoris A21JP2]
MKKSNLVKKSIFSLVSLAAIISASACTTTNKQVENQVVYKTDRAVADNKVVLQTAQNQYFPLMIALQELVPIYNELEKNKEGFLPVELQKQDVTKATSEANLAKNVITNIESNSSDVPNLILGNQASAYLINKYDKLLDLSDTNINKEIFPKKVINQFNLLPGQKNVEKIYNIPFDITDTDALVFNLDIMNVIFELVEKNGGNVDKNLEVYKKAQVAKENTNQIPETSMFKYLKAKDSNAFKDFKIDNTTFSSIESIQNFSLEVFNRTKFDIASLSAEQKAKLSDVQIFTIDYQEDAFKKDLINRTNGQFLWSLDTKENNLIKFDLKDNQKLQTEFSTLWDKWNSYNKQSLVEKVGEDTKSYFSIKYANNKTQWASWDIRTYNTAIAFAAAVGTNQSYDSITSRNFFSRKDATAPKRWASNIDVNWNSQVFNSNADKNLKTSYNLGGSSLIALS